MQARNIKTATLLAGLLITSSAHAHIRLLKPTSWIEEDSSGGPQKGGPCGPGGYDDAPITETDKIDEYHAGETIDVTWEVTVPHTGFYRVALAENRAELLDPDLQLDGLCNYSTPPPSGAHGNVLADNLSSDLLTTKVTLPDQPCEKCTLQLIQFMTVHPPDCIYYHCAYIKILPKDGSSEGGAGGMTGGSGGMGAAGMGAAGMTMSMAGMTGSAGAAGMAGSGMMLVPVGGSTAMAAGTTGAAGTTAAGSTAPTMMIPAAAGSTGGATQEESSSCSIANTASGASNVLSVYALGIAALALLRRRVAPRRRFAAALRRKVR